MRCEPLGISQSSHKPTAHSVTWNRSILMDVGMFGEG